MSTPAMSREEKLALLARLTREKANKPKKAPLSFAQQRHYFLSRLDPDSFAHNVFRAFEISGPLAASSLEAAIADLLRRHESLRATFVEDDGEPAQKIAPASLADEFRLEIEDLSQASVPAELAKAAAEAEARRPFDLAQDLPVRWRLLRLAGEQWLLLLSLHHIIADGWSLGILLRELFFAYNARQRGETPAFEPLPISFSDFAIWQQQKLDLKPQLSFWKNALEGAPTVLELATDFPRPALASLAGANISLDFDAATTSALRQLARAQGMTPFMVLLGVFTVLLHRTTGQHDLLLGTPIANRNRREVEGLIGSFANTLVLRSRYCGRESFLDHLAQIRRHTLEAFDHQDLPFERLVEELQPQRDLSRNPLFQVMFALIEARGSQADPTTAVSELEIRPYSVSRGLSKVDLTCELQDEGATLSGYFEYASDLYQEGSMLRLAQTFERCLAGLLAAPAAPLERLDLLGPELRRQVLEQWQPAGAGLEPAAPLPQRLLAVARQHPAAIAAIEAPARRAGEAPAAGRQLSYGELAAASAALAARLREQGVRRGDRVGVCLERSLEAMVALLAIWRAGAAYVTLDPGYPVDRLAYMIDDSGLSLLLCQEKWLARLPAEKARLLLVPAVPELIAAGASGAAFVDAPLTGDDLAYMIYTSGSTGRPKGVLVPHRGLENHALAMAARYQLEAADRVLQFASLSFDLAGEEIYPTWLAGATLVLRHEQQSLALADFLEMLAAEAISVANLPTPYWHEWVIELQEGRQPPPPALRLVIVGTEQALAERVNGWLRVVGERPRWINSYGPSEATITATSWDPPAAAPLDRVMIGKPIARTRALVLDAAGEPLPPGCPGELCLGGAGLAHGYHRRPALTAEKFVPDPFSPVPGARLYRSGDRVRQSPSGELEFLGRLDQQVKVRGFRIEIGEIEAFLADHPAVADGVVLAREIAPGDQRLVAYLALTPESAGRTSENELRRHLESRLPSYMVPGAFLILPTLPLTRSGKIDRDSLRALPLESASLDDAPWEAPRDPIEEVVAEIWSNLLGGRRVGLHDDFFRLGGHSLLATRMLSRLRATLGVELPLKEVFEASTLVSLAGRVAAARAAKEAESGHPAPPLVARARGSEPLPLSFAQQRMWFLAQLDPQSPAYNVPNALRLEAELEVPLLERCLSEIVRRHESLRTTFSSEHGKPRQVINPPAAFPLPRFEVASEEEAHARVGALSLVPFDLERDLPIRCELIAVRGADGRPLCHWLALIFHHIASDGWSTDLFLHELEVLYPALGDEEPCPLPELPLQYADFAAWQNEALSGPALAKQLDFWRRQLHGVPGLIDLPLDRPRPAVRQHHGGRVHFDLGEELGQRFRELGRHHGCSLFMTFLASWGGFLSRLTGQHDLAIGTPVAGRHRPEIERLIGFFANTLVLRLAQPEGATFEALLARARGVVLDAYDHQDLPFEKLVDELQPQRETSHSPIFQVTFTLHHESTFRHESLVNPPGPGSKKLEWSLPSIDNQTARFDLALVLVERARGFRGFFEYDRDLFDAATIERFVACYKTWLEALAAAPQAPVAGLELVPAAELAALAAARFPGEAVAAASLQPLSLPLDFKRPVASSGLVAQVELAVPAELEGAVATLAAARGTRRETLLLAALAALLHRWTGQNSIGIGIDSGAAIALELAGVQDFAALIELTDRALATPLAAAAEVHGRFTENAAAPGRRGELDLCWPAGQGQLRLAYDPELFEASTPTRCGEGYLALLAAAAADPHQGLGALPVMGAADRARLAATCVAPQPRLGDSMLGPIEAVAAERPEAPAIAFGAARLSYAELLREVDQLASHLARHGVGPGQLVGILLERSLELPIALLAVLRTGAAYLPLDPAFPRERLDLMLEISGARLVLEHRGLFARLGLQSEVELYDLDRPRPAVAVAAFPPPAPESLAYVLFTSGSTGRPKGVMISQRALANFIASLARDPGCRPDDVFVSVTTISFDIFGLEFYLPLQCGALMVLADRETSADPWRLGELLRETGATLFQATPATWRILLDSGWPGQPGLLAFSGGEALLLELAERICAKVGSLYNIYGPTETTIYSSLRPVDPARVLASGEVFVSLGEPVAATTLHVVDRYGNLTPPGVMGELLIGGEGLAYGYFGQPALTADRFLPDGFTGSAGARVYRTGDLVRRRASDLRIDFLGRLDHQVKIRGYRIELGEIEGLLERQPAIAQAAVVVRGEGANLRLEAYLVRQPGVAGEPADWRAALLERLPSYMMPSVFVELPAFPLTPNGKVDRKALAPPAAALSSSEQALRELEQVLTRALGRPPAGLPLEVSSPSGARQPFGVPGEIGVVAADGTLVRSGIRGRLLAGEAAPLLDLMRPPEPAAAAPQSKSDFVAPRNEVEEKIAAIWAMVLGHEKVSVLADFFELGGHSLLATQVMARLRETFDIELPLRLLFEKKTVAGLADEIVGREVEGADEDLLRRLLAEL